MEIKYSLRNWEEFKKNIRYTDFIIPVNEESYRSNGILYVIIICKNLRKIPIQIFSPITFSLEEKDLIEKRKKQCEETIKKYMEDKLSGNRIGLRGHKGYFRIINFENRALAGRPS